MHFLIDAVDRLPAVYFNTNRRGTGDEQYPPRMMLALLIYCYATGRFSSRVIEDATHSDVVVRYICGGNLHPDHDTICAFRRKNRELFEKAFVEVLLMAHETCGLQKVGTVSIDGTKIKANASKHAAVSYKRAEYEQKNAAHGEKRKNRKPRCPRPPVPPPKDPPDNKQYNFTDPESRIMKAAGNNFEQAFNAQAAVDTETLLIVGEYVTDAPTDKQQLVPVLQCIREEVATPENILADTGYYGDDFILEAESGNGPTVYCALAKSGHRLRVADLEKRPLPKPHLQTHP